jgi:hypothetical protein
MSVSRTNLEDTGSRRLARRELERLYVMMRQSALQKKKKKLG